MLETRWARGNPFTVFSHQSKQRPWKHAGFTNRINHSQLILNRNILIHLHLMLWNIFWLVVNIQRKYLGGMVRCFGLYQSTEWLRKSIREGWWWLGKWFTEGWTKMWTWSEFKQEVTSQLDDLPDSPTSFRSQMMMKGMKRWKRRSEKM
jgi:hypothetical protein